MRRNAKERYTTAKGTFKLYDKDGKLLEPKDKDDKDEKKKQNKANG